MTRKRKRFLSGKFAMAVAGVLCCWCADNGIGGAFGEIKAAKGGGSGSGSGGGNGGVMPTPDSTKAIYDYRDDEKEYRVVKIGEQWWMAKNLNYKSGNSWCYDDKDTNCNTYGRLYDWDTAMEVCPEGWHLPSNSEWTVLVTAVGSPSGTQLKLTSGWFDTNGNPYGNGTDDFGFSALPGGYRGSGGGFGGAGNYGIWWTATENGASNAYHRYMSYGLDGLDGVNSNYDLKSYAWSVRCVGD